MTTYETITVPFTGKRRPSPTTVYLPGLDLSLLEPTPSAPNAPELPSAPDGELSALSRPSPTPKIDCWDAIKQLERQRKLKAFNKYVVAPLLALTYPVASGISAIQFLWGEDTQAAGIDMSVKAQINTDYSQLAAGLPGGIRAQGHRDILGKSLGARATVDPSVHLDLLDKGTREGIKDVFHHREALEAHIGQTAQHNFEIDGLAGIEAALLVGLILGEWALRDRKAMGGKKLEDLNDELQGYFAHNKRLRAGVMAAAVALSFSGAGYTLLHSDTRTIPGGIALYGPIKELQPFLSLGQSTEKLDNRTSVNLAHEVATHPYLQRRPGFMRMVIVDDVENNAGQAGHFGELIPLTHADFGVMLGDWATYAKWKIGANTIDTAVHKALGGKIIMASGKHDIASALQYAAAYGIIVGNNKTLTENGVKILPLQSVYKTSVNSGGGVDYLRDPAITEDIAVQNAVDTMCRDHDDFVMAHEHNFLIELAKAVLVAQAKRHIDCSPVAYLGGASFASRSYLKTVTVSHYPGSARVIVSDSFGAHHNVKPGFGSIKSPTDGQVIDFNPTTGEMIRTPITFRPNGTVRIPAEPIVQVAGSPAPTDQGLKNPKHPRH